MKRIEFKKIILIVIFLFISNYNYGQDYFLKQYSSSLTGQNFVGRALHELPNGKFAVVANDSYKGGWLMLTDSVGQLQMLKHYYGYSQFMASELHDFIVLNDGNYLLVGSFKIPSSNSKHGIVKINEQGEVIWGKTLINDIGIGRDFFVKDNTGKQSLIVDNTYNYGFMISELDSGGNIINTIRIRDSLNSTININKVKPLSTNGFIIGGTINFGEPVLMIFDSSYNNLLSVSYPDFYDCEDVIPTKDNGFLCLFRDSTVYYSFHIVKTDSVGNPLWTKTFSDSLKLIFPHLLHENDDNTFYCLFNWMDINSPIYKYNAAVMLIDSIGNMISIKDSMVIQLFSEIKKTSDSRFCTLIARGVSSYNKPAIWMTDTLFNQTINCLPYSTTTAINQSNSSATFVNRPLQVFNYNYSPQLFNVLTINSINNPTQICLSSGFNCTTEYNTLSITSCDGYIHPGDSIPLTSSGIYTYNNLNTQGCDSIVIINLDIIPISPVQITGDSLLCIGDATVLTSTNVYSSYIWSTGDTTPFITVNNTGNYELIVTDTNGCVDSTSYLVTVMPFPVVNIIPQGSISIYQGDSVILAATPFYASYQWVRNNLIIPGANSVIYTAKTSGKYKCIVQNEALCSDTSNAIWIKVKSVPITDLDNYRIGHEFEVDLLVSPSPNNGIFELQSPSGHLQIFNKVGELVLSADVISEKNYFNFSKFPDGIYLIVLNTGKDLLSRKMLISH